MFGLQPLWRDEVSIGMGMAQTDAEVVLHTMDLPGDRSVHYLVDDVRDAVAIGQRAGCAVREAPFEVARCWLTPVREHGVPAGHEQGPTCYLIQVTDHRVTPITPMTGDAGLAHVNAWALAIRTCRAEGACACATEVEWSGLRRMGSRLRPVWVRKLVSRSGGTGCV